MKTLNLILGAGFSFNAGLPLVKQLSAMFQTDLSDKLIRMSSGEWGWRAGKDEITIHNGLLNWDTVSYGYIMNEIVSQFNFDVGPIENYEIFYDYIENKDNAWYKEIGAKSLSKYKLDYPSQQSDLVINRIGTFAKSEIIELINHLIADALTKHISDADLLQAYAGFLEFIKKYERVFIHTLNHDVIMERLLTLTGIKFADGFSREKSELISGDSEQPMLTFLNHFPGDFIALIKLHGSIDMIRYDVGLEQGAYVGLDGRYIYFKPDNYSDKHSPIRINPETKEIVQRFPSGIVPRFITGLSKPNKIKNDYMYKVLFAMFKESQSTTDADSVIIGYGYGDEHVNEIIQKLPLNAKIININPGSTFPYEQYKSVTEFKYMSEAFPY